MILSWIFHVINEIPQEKLPKSPVKQETNNQSRYSLIRSLKIIFN